MPVSKCTAKKKALIQRLAIGGFKTDAVRPEKPFVTWLRARGFSLPAIRAKTRRKSPLLILPRTIENKYVVLLRRLVAEWRKLYLQMVDPSLEGLTQEAYVFKPPESVGVKTDSWPDRLTEIIAAYESQIKVTLQPVEAMATDIAYDISALNLRQWKRATKKVLGIDIFASEPWLVDQLNSFAKQNVNLITKLAEETRSEVKRLIEDGFQKGRRIENIRKDILSRSKLDPGRFKKARTRAEFIARDQTSKLNGQLTQLRQNEIGIDRYEWKDVDDVKVRPSHAAMDNRLCKWANASVYSSDGGKTWRSRSGIGGVEQHPGQDYQCRCVALADFSSILDEETILAPPKKPILAPPKKPIPESEKPFKVIPKSAIVRPKTRKVITTFEKELPASEFAFEKIELPSREVILNRMLKRMELFKKQEPLRYSIAKKSPGTLSVFFSTEFKVDIPFGHPLADEVEKTMNKLVTLIGKDNFNPVKIKEGKTIRIKKK